MSAGAGHQLRPFLRMAVAVLCVTLIAAYCVLGTGGPARFARPLPAAQERSAPVTTARPGFLVWSPRCQIPDTNPYHASIRKIMKTPDPIVCSRVPPLTYVTGGTRIVLEKGLVHKYVSRKQQLSCCYSEVTRVNTKEGVAYNESADNYYNISKCTTFDQEARLPAGAEFILVRCYGQTSGKSTRKEVYSNMHSVVPVKPEVRDRVEAGGWDAGRPSVLLLGIDSVSRLNLMRTMPRTVDYMQRGGWQELRGYNKIGDNTFPNLMAILTGLSVEQVHRQCWHSQHTRLDDCPYVWEDFSQAGYVTMYVEDEPKMSTFNYHKTGFERPPTDYYLRPFLLAAESQLHVKKRDGLGICLGPTSTTEHMLRYVVDFATTFRNALYFALVWINNFCHNNHNTPAVMDVRFVKFFQELFESGAVNSTIIVFFSDHGMRFGNLRVTALGWLEERLPFIHIWIPQGFREKYPDSFKNLQTNANRLTSPYDLYLTLREVADKSWLIDNHNSSRLRDCPRCSSLFSEIPENRSCDEAGISPHWCVCSQYVPVAINSSAVLESARFVLDGIHARLDSRLNSNLTRACARLTLRRILQARVKVHPPGNDPDHDDYVIMLEAAPGGALFESTIRRYRRRGTMKTMGIVSRLNSYAAQSKCVKDSDLKLYCHCVR